MRRYRLPSHYPIHLFPYVSFYMFTLRVNKSLLLLFHFIPSPPFYYVFSGDEPRRWGGGIGLMVISWDHPSRLRPIYFQSCLVQTHPHPIKAYPNSRDHPSLTTGISVGSLKAEIGSSPFLLEIFTCGLDTQFYSTHTKLFIFYNYFISLFFQNDLFYRIMYLVHFWNI